MWELHLLWKTYFPQKLSTLKESLAYVLLRNAMWSRSQACYSATPFKLLLIMPSCLRVSTPQKSHRVILKYSSVTKTLCSLPYFLAKWDSSYLIISAFPKTMQTCLKINVRVLWSWAVPIHWHYSTLYREEDFEGATCRLSSDWMIYKSARKVFQLREIKY